MKITETLSWAAALARALFAAKLANEQGIHVLADGGIEYTAPNPAAMWPPHRPHPHFKRSRCSAKRLERRAKKKADALTLGVKDGRLGYVSRQRLLQVCP